MILDMFGIPGGGKTYCSNELKNKLFSNGFPFLDISRFSGMPLWMKIFYKVVDYTIFIFPKYRRQRKKIIDLFPSKEVVSKYVPLSFKYCVNDIVLSTLIHDLCKRSKRIFINDEGQIQKYVFLMVQFECPKDKIFSVFKEYSVDSILIYLRSNEENAFENIKKRNRHVCPMDEIDDSSLKAYLHDFYEGCEYFKEKLNFHESSYFCQMEVLSNKPLIFA